jgi:muramoyltetrapeptide carboxypeptidase
MSFAFDYIRSRGHNPVYDERLFDSCNQFAGDDDARAALIQEYLDRDDIDVMLCARGGYGTVRIIDKLNFEKFLQKPKWIAGYSDVTVLHAKLQKLGCESLHSTMPINFADNTKESLDSLFDAIEGKRISYEISSSDMNIFGKAEAQLVGGNISVLYSLLGSDIFPDTDGKILFLEDLDEYLYHIDRMMTALQRAGKLDNIKGLIVGGLTKMHDNNIPFGMSAEEIILEKVKDKNIPVCFNFPAGHIDDNRSLVLGRTSYLEVKSETSKIEN